MELSIDKRSSGTYYRIRESYREGDKVKKRTIRYLGTLENILERFSKPIPEDAELETVPFGPAATLRWAFEDLGLDDFFTELLDPDGNHVFPAWRKIFLLVWRRFLQDLSMKAAVEKYDRQVFPFWWREDVTTVQRLYQFLGEGLSEEKIETAQEGLASRVLDGKQVEECHLDTTNYCTYVREDTEYLRIGKSKDGVVGRRLVGLSLALTERGLPILSTAHPGNRHDSKLFEGLFKRVCQRIESAGSDLEKVTIVFDRGFDDGDNFDLTKSSDAYVVAGVKRNRNPVKERIHGAELDEFQLSHETNHGKCYVRDSGRVEIGENEWRVVLSYHDATREKIQERMREAKEEAESLLDDLQDKITRGGRGRPITEEGIERKLREVLGKWYESLDWSFKPEERSLKVGGWNEKWDRDYEKAGIHAIVTDHEDWSPSKIARTYFDRNDIESMFHLTKKALVVPVEPPYVKEDHLVRAHLFLVFVGLLCYQHIRRELPGDMTDEEIKSAMEELKMVIAVEDGSPQFKLANVNERTKPLLSTLGLEEYLPE